MRKIFTFAAAVLASFSLWAQATPDVAVDSMTNAEATTYFKSHGDVTLLYAGEYQKTGNYYNVKADQTNNTAYVGITSDKEIQKVAFLVTGNGKNKNINAGLIGYKTVAATPDFTKADYASYVNPSVAIAAANYSDAQWVEFDLSDQELKAVYFAKQWKNVVVGSAASASYPSGNAQSLFVYGIRVWLAGESVTYTATYKANNGTAEADSVNTAAKKVAENMFTVPEGKKFTGWNTSADGTGTAYAPGAKLEGDLTLYAQWATVCYEEVYNFNAGLGSAYVKAADATIIGHDTLRLSNTAGRIVIKPAEGGFKAGDIIEMAGLIGNPAKKWGIKIDGGQTFVNEAGEPCVLTGVLNANVDSLSFGRADGTTTTITSLIIKREAANCKEIDSKVETLIGAAINKVALDASDLNELISSKSVNLLDEYVTAPTVTFTKKVVTTYDDESTKTDTVDVDVVAEALGESQWKANITLGDNTYSITMQKATSFTVTYLYDTDTLGTEVVAAGGHPAEYVKYEKKALSLFGGWYSNAALTEAVQISEEVINSNKTYYAKFTVAYAKSMNIEQWVLDNGKNNNAFKALLQERGFAYENINELDSLNDAKANRNEPYLGLKIKKTGGYIAFNVLAGKTLAVKFGYGEAPIKINVNGVDSTYSPVEKNLGEFDLSAAQTDTYIKISTTSDKTVVIKQIMINEDIAEVVLPGKPEFTAAAAPAENGSILLNGVDTLKAHQGDTIMVTYLAASGYQIDTIKVDGKAIKEDQGIYKFVMPGNDVTVTATFKVYEETSFAITIAQSIANGNVSLNKYSANQGDTIIVTATPYDGYKIGQVTYDNKEIVPENGVYFFIMPAHAVEVNVTFIEDKPVVIEYTITIGEMQNGTVTADKEKAQKDELVTLTVNPAEGYELEDISLEGIELALIVDENGNCTFKMPAQDVTVLATFKAKEEGFENIDASTKAVKFFENGKLLIKRGDKVYDAKGVVVE